MVTFDAPIRESCVTSRVITNTPLQALVLMNDPVYVEAARALGARMIEEGGASVSSRLMYGFRLCTSRFPTAAELRVLLRVHKEMKAHYGDHEKEVEALLKVGESPVNDSLDPAELATWTAVGNTLLNLDATIHRG